MTDSGPTTAGSIVAKLRMQRDQWVADKAKTVADARELGSLEPTIHIRSTAAEAVAKLKEAQLQAQATGDSFANAQTHVSVAQFRSKATADELAGAIRRLAVAQSSTGVSADKLAMAEEAVSRATRNHATSVNRLTAATAELAAMQQAETVTEEARSAALEVSSKQTALYNQYLYDEAKASDKAAASAKNAAAANKNNAGVMGLIIGAAAVLIPMLVPLAANVVAVTGAFTGMGVAGILGLLGMKNAMAAGTAQGAQFSTGLQTLRGDLSQLEGTAAAGMLSMFNTAVGDINAAMPSLNGEISNFTSLLSGVTGSVLPGILNGFRVLNPLFMAAGQHIQAIADGFLRWTQDGGLQQFASYAISTIPQVEGTLQALGSAIIHILQALTPLGTVGLVVLQDLSNVINAIPVPVLGDLAAAAIAGFAAFKLWSLLVPVINSVSKSIAGAALVTEASTGPIGWAVAAVSALAAAFAISAASSNSASAAMATYTDALAQDNGVLGNHVRAQAAKALADNGAIADGKLLGLTAKQVTDAALGNVPAMKAATAATNAANAAYQAGARRGTQFGDSASALTDKQFKAAKATGDFTKKLAEQKDAIDATVKSGIDYNSAMSLGGSVAQTLATDLGMTVTGYEQLVSAQNTATAAAKTWKTETDILNGVAQSLEQTTINLAGDYQTMATQIIGNIKSMGKAAATSTAFNTAGGLANHTIILKTIQDAQAQADNIDQSVTKQTGSKAKGDAAAAAFAAADKIRLLDTLTGLGLNRQAVKVLIDQIDLLHSPPPVVVTVQTAAALAKLAALKSTVASVLAALAGAHAAARTSVGVNLSAVQTPAQARWSIPGHADGATVTGPGTSTSDSVLRRLSVGEEVIRESAASQARPFLKAFNANPSKALASVAASGNSSGGVWNVHVVNKSGATITDLIELYIERNGRTQQISLANGLQRGAF